MLKHSRFIYIVHTNTPSASFASSMCAYITGQIGAEIDDASVTAALEFEAAALPDLARQFAGTVGQASSGESEPVRPYTTLPTPPKYHVNAVSALYGSIGIYFSARPTKEMMQLMGQRGRLFTTSRGINITGIQLAEQVEVDYDGSPC